MRLRIFEAIRRQKSAEEDWLCISSHTGKGIRASNGRGVPDIGKYNDEERWMAERREKLWKSMNEILSKSSWRLISVQRKEQLPAGKYLHGVYPRCKGRRIFEEGECFSEDCLHQWQDSCIHLERILLHGWEAV